MSNRITLDGVSVHLGDRTSPGNRASLGDRLALENVTLDLDHQRVAVIGSNGSGKSTFARLLGGLVTATTGSVSVRGLDPARDATGIRREVGIVFSNPDAQIIMPTVAEDAAFSLRALRLPRSERDARVTAALAEFGLADLAEQPSHDLSGGQKQLLALCGALIREPSLLIADEPTAFLDARNSRIIAEHLFSETALVLVTHHLELARRCDVAVLFDAGRLVGVGEPGSIIAHYERMLE